MKQRMVMLGAGAVGGYVGGHFAQAGHDVTLIDFWHEHIEAIRKDGLHISGMTPEETFTVQPQTKHLHEVSALAHEAPIDIAFIAVKSYDTDWVTTMIKPYLAPNGFVLTLQNCINEETIAGIVGWGKTLGCIASRISVELYEPGKIRRQSPRGSNTHTVFRVGEVHGRITERLKNVAALLSAIDGTKMTSNLWGERWSKLCLNAMGNGVSAATGLSAIEIITNDTARRTQIQLGAEAVRVGQALGFELENLGKIEPAVLIAAADGDEKDLRIVEDIMLSQTTSGERGASQRPSMGQDMIKGRRTEIEYINGFVAEKAEEVGLAAPLNARLVALVQAVERGERTPNPDNLSELL